MITNCH